MFVYFGREPNAKPYDVPCPTCQAKATQSCDNHGMWSPVPHDARVQLSNARESTSEAAES